MTTGLPSRGVYRCSVRSALTGHLMIGHHSTAKSAASDDHDIEHFIQLTTYYVGSHAERLLWYTPY